MKTSIRSFQQGVREASETMGDIVPAGYEEDYSPPVPEEQLDQFQFLRGQIVAILLRLAERRNHDNRTA